MIKFRCGNKTIGFIGAATLLFSACVNTHGDRGYMAKFSHHDQIKPGVTDKEGVLGIMGSPSATSGFGQETWYYISTRTSQAAFFDPKIEGQKVIAVTFNPSGIVGKVTVDEGKNRRDIAISGDKTPTAGHDVNAVEQLLGNLGRFNTDRAQNP